MGIFSQMNNTSGAAPAFDGSRWEPVLRSMDIKFGTDDEGDHFGDWDGARVWFEAKGEQREILVVRAVMDVRPPLDAYASVRWSRTTGTASTCGPVPTWSAPTPSA